MKNLNRDELKEFTDKYFCIYKDDIRRVTYIEYKDAIEYLINDNYLFIVYK